MTSGKQSLKEPKPLQGYVEKVEREAFEQIVARERLTNSQVLRKAVQEYISNHAEGNPQFTLEKFQNSDFKAIPTLLSPTDKWTRYINDSDDNDKNQILNKASEVVSIIKSHFYNESKRKRKQKFGT